MTELNETSRLQKAQKAFMGKNYVRSLGIISPANPMARMTSKEENQRLVQKFKDCLRRTGEYYFPVKGKYGITEPSFMIFNTTRSDLEMWAKVFKQESFIYGEFADGEFDFEIWKRKPNKESYYLFDTQRGYVERSEDGDYYTAIGRNFKFSIPFPKFMESVDAHNELIADRAKQSAVYAKLVEEKLTKILDESFTPLSRRMERSFVYGAEWQKQYKNGGKPNHFILKKQFNGIKQVEFPFVCEVSECCAEIAFINLGRAYKNFFGKRSKYPKFKKKGIHDSFGLNNLNFQIEGNHIKLAKMQPMRMAEPLRFDGKIMSGTVSCVTGKWYISIAVEIHKDLTLPKTGKYVGVDLGVKDIAITSDGYKFVNPRWIHKSEKKLKRFQRELARRQRASKRRERTRLRLACQHNRISNQRKDWIHKLTTYLVRNYDTISLEDLNVRGMVKNHNLAKAITNVAFGEFNRQIEYKAQMYGRRIYRVDRFFPSSKTCSVCGCVQEKMPLNVREWTCPECGAHHDRDINAAANLLRQAMPEVTHGKRLALVISEISDVTKLDSLNRESYKLICYGKQSIMTKEEMTEFCKAKVKYTVYSYRPIRIEDKRYMGWRKRDQNTGEITQGLCLRALLNDKKAG